MKMSTIEHNTTALKGYLNNPRWYALGRKLKEPTIICECTGKVCIPVTGCFEYRATEKCRHRMRLWKK